MKNLIQEYRTIRLYGVLGVMFGRVHKLVVDTPKEAVKALCITIPGFERFLQTAKNRGLTFSVFIGKKNIGKEELEFQGIDDIRIAPIIIGSKKSGVFQTILGAVLVVVGVVVGVMTSWTGIGGTIGYGMAMSGRL